VEALLFASGQPLGVARLAQALEVEAPAVQAALDELALAWRAREGAIELVEIAGGWRFMTRPAFHPDVAALRRKAEVERLSPAALESLAVVAYRQPITRADIEAVRGVQCGPVLRLLLDRDLIRITGRSPDPGHPLLYGTTKRFLDHFGLKSLKALPDVKDLLETP
ncbi:MAG: SMC-Scp complex subunit ScpB, partial [Planctomycetes bacterium]|nr:SMC-Scp complex subunit ScpB [Planctomycetota bacterium]